MLAFMFELASLEKTRHIDGFQSRDETAMFVYKTIANYGTCFAL